MSSIQMVTKQYGPPRCRMWNGKEGRARQEKKATGTFLIDTLLAGGWKIIEGTGVNLPDKYLTTEPPPMITSDPPVEYKRKGRPPGSKNKTK